jgi:hypothetical protein
MWWIWAFPVSNCLLIITMRFAALVFAAGGKWSTIRRRQQGERNATDILVYVFLFLLSVTGLHWSSQLGRLEVCHRCLGCCRNMVSGNIRLVLSPVRK